MTSFGEQGRGLHAHEYGRLRYLDDTPDGDFNNRDTFRDGTPVLTMAYRQQVILDTGEGVPGIAGTGTFTVMNLLTVTAVQTFELGGENYRLGRHRDQFGQFYSGAPPATTPPSGVFAGYAVVIERARERGSSDPKGCTEVPYLMASERSVGVTEPGP